MAVIFVADGNPDQGLELSLYLGLKGFDTHMATSLSELQRSVRKAVPDIIVMELDFPDGDGLMYLSKARQQVMSYFVIVMSRAFESDRIMAFELGADDYMIKPYSKKELSLRLEAMLRCRFRERSSERTVFRVRSSSLVIDWTSHLLYIDGRAVSLTASEWKIVAYLSDKSGQFVSRQQLLSSCFPDCLDSSDRIIDTHIKNIRAKIGPAGMDWIETVRGYGYRFLGHDAAV